MTSLAFLAPWIHMRIAQALGWTLLHFVWEGAVLAILLAASRLFRTSARLRYGLACATLAAMPLAFAATLVVMYLRQPPPVHVAPLVFAPVADLPLVPMAAPPPPRFSVGGILDRIAWLVPLWCVGVLFFYVRALAAWFSAHRLRRRGVCLSRPEWQLRLNQLAERMRLSRPVVLLESCLTDAPVLIGYLWPVVLLPLGCLTGLSTAQIECILLHELAHVVRHDYLVNLLQSVVEGLLFYHPAVWWISRTARTERENCCDDCVVELMGDARRYAATLAALEHRRAVTPQAALAANGGSLMNRIRRLTMESRTGPTSIMPAASAAVLLLLFAAGLVAVPAKFPRTRRPRQLPAMAAAAAIQDNLAAPYQKWLNEDVVYIISNAERARFLTLASDEERQQFIEDFWLRRDPTPDTAENEFKAEHYRRMTFANEHFAAPGKTGWKTDRGRIYILYGAPDEIDDHSTIPAGEPATALPFQQWRYGLLDGIGSNVIIEFVDRDRTGDFKMTMDPAEKDALLAQGGNAYAEVSHHLSQPSKNGKPAPTVGNAGYASVVSTAVKQSVETQQTMAAERKNIATPYRKWLNEDAAYIITDEERASFLRLPADQERENFIESFWLRRDPTPGTAQNEYKQEHYRRIAFANEKFSTAIPGWKTDRGRIYIQYGPPDSITANSSTSVTWNYRFIEGMGMNVKLEFQDTTGSGDFHLTGKPPAPQAADVFVGQKDLAVSVIVPDAKRTAPGVIAPGDVLDVSYVRGEVGGLSELETQIDQKSKSCAGLATKYQSTFPDLGVCREQLAALEAQRDQLANNLRAQVESTPTRRVQGRVTVGPDGAVALSFGQFKAAGLTAEQLQNAIGGSSQVTVEHSDQSVTVLVPLPSASGKFHVFGEVTTPERKVVQSFDAEVSGQPSFARYLTLKPGSYHLVVILREANGGTRKSELDFTAN